MSSNREIVCPHCAGINRVPDDRPAQAARCGKCKEPLFVGRPAEADAAMFEKQTRRSDVPVLVDVWAPWCGPCRMMAPTFAQAAQEFEPQVRFLKLNADETQTPAALRVRGIPTVILFHEGREIARQPGLMSGPQLRAWLENALTSIANLETQA